MKLEQSFEVAAPIDQVWAALNDLERVAPCLPGAAITDHDEDGTYHGTFQVKLGPTTAAYRGTIKIESADESTHTATLKARGTDKRGQGGAIGDDRQHAHRARRRHDRRTPSTDFTITGRLARFGRGGMMEDISNRLLRDFSTCLSVAPGRRADRAQRRGGRHAARRRPRRSPPRRGEGEAWTPRPPPPARAPRRPGRSPPEMEQRLSLITLGVTDVPAARAFYEALGWRCDTDPSLDVAFFQLGGIALAVWDRKQLAEDSTVTDRGGFGGVTLAYHVRSPEEVAAALAQAEAAKPIGGIGLFFSVLWERVRRRFGSSRGR